MGTIQVRSLAQPDETRSFPNGVVEMVTIAETDWCMVLHEGLLRVRDGGRPGQGRD